MGSMQLVGQATLLVQKFSEQNIRSFNFVVEGAMQSEKHLYLLERWHSKEHRIIKLTFRTIIYLCLTANFFVTLNKFSTA